MKPGHGLVGATTMLSIRYARDIPAPLIDLVEHHARHEGVSLGALEIIGASLDHVEAFIVACEDGQAKEFLRLLDLVPPDGQIERARWQAQRLFG